MSPSSARIIILAFATLTAFLVKGADIGLSTDIKPAGYYVPKWPYNSTDISTPFKIQLNNGYVCKYGASLYGANQYQAMLTLAPCNYITEHYHPEAYEFNHILKGGSLKWNIVLGNGTVINGSTPLGATMMLPMGLTHVILNDNCVPTTMFHYFPNIVDPLFIFSVPAIVNMPDAFKVSTFGPNGLALNTKRIPDGIHTLDDTCLKRCKLTAADFEGPNSKFGKNGGLCSQLNSVGF